MTYVTQSEIETFTGMANTDFKVGGVTMTPDQWTDFITVMIPNVEQIIHRYCNVTSFDSTTSIVELHSGKGASNDEYGTTGASIIYGAMGSTYLPSDRTFNLREMCYTLTSVEEDTNGKLQIPNWVTRAVRSVSVPGDYEVRVQNEVTSVVFNQNVPMYGENNIRITYKCGYGPNSAQYNEIKLMALRMMSNMLLLKKKVQEAVNIRAQGIRDYSQMFDIMNESAILTPNIKEVLDKYKRYPIEGDFFS